MSAITTAASGDWSSTGTWTGGTIPGDGDTVTLNHAVTVDVNAVVGSAPATGGTAAIVANAALTLAAGVTLELKGDLKIHNVVVTLGAGAVIEGNAASGTAYYIKISTVWNDPNPRLVCNGTSGAHCILRKKAGAAGVFALTDDNLNSGGQLDATYTDFLNLGSAAIPGHAFYPDADLSAYHLRLQQCTVDGCGEFKGTVTIEQATKVQLLDSIFTNGAGPFHIRWFGGAGNVTTGARVLQHCAFDGSAPLSLDLEDVTMIECRVVAMTIASQCTFNAAARDNLIYRTPATNGDSVLFYKGIIQRWYYVHTAAGNPHYLQQPSEFDSTVQLCVFENLDGDAAQDGDVLMAAQSSTPITQTVKHNLILPSAGGRGIGALFGALGDANTTAVIEHNTMISDNTESFVVVGETYDGHAGLIGSLKSNLFWNATARSGQFIMDRFSPSTVQDIAAAASVANNGKWNISAGNDGGGINHQTGGAFFSSGTPGIGDVTLSANPFVDSSRNITAWGATKGDADVATTLAHLFALDAGYDVQALLDWVRAGFQPTAVALQAAHDTVAPSNGWIGAVSGPLPSSEQEGYRFRNDDGSETTATWLAAQDTDINAVNGTAIRFRGILNATGDLASKRIGVGYKVNGGQLREVH